MTRKELKIIESFLEDMDISNDDIEVLNSIYHWLRTVYHTEGAKKLEDYKEYL